MLRIAVCDDETEFIARISSYLHALQGEFERPFDIHSFTSAEDFRYEIEGHREYELVILDIQMPDADGIRLAEQVRDLSPAAVIVFMTGFHQHVFRSFAVNPSGFIRKPFHDEEVCATLRKALHECDAVPAFTITGRSGFHKILYRDILCFESMGRKIIMRTTDGEESFNGRLDEISRQLEHDATCFWRIHKSIIINRSYIKSIDYEIVRISDGKWEKEFHISQKYQPIIRQKCLDSMKSNHSFTA